MEERRGGIIAVVEDEDRIRDLIRAYLEAEGYTVLAAEDGPAGLALLKREPDLFILDLMLPGMDGEDVCRRIRQESDVPVLMLTAKSSEEERIRGLGLGADDYVVKPFSPRELVLRVKAILKRSGVSRSEEKRFSFGDGELEIDELRHEVKVRGRSVTITPTEFKALLFFVRNEGIVLSRAQIIDAVQGYQFDGYDRTVDAHIKNLRRKIEVNPREPRFIRTVYGMGYKFTADPED